MSPLPKRRRCISPQLIALDPGHSQNLSCFEYPTLRPIASQNPLFPSIGPITDTRSLLFTPSCTSCRAPQPIPGFRAFTVSSVRLNTAYRNRFSKSWDHSRERLPVRKTSSDKPWIPTLAIVAIRSRAHKINRWLSTPLTKFLNTLSPNPRRLNHSCQCSRPLVEL